MRELLLLRKEQCLRQDYSCKLVEFNPIPTRKSVLAELQRLQQLPVSILKGKDSYTIIPTTFNVIPT